MEQSGIPFRLARQGMPQHGPRLGREAASAIRLARLAERDERPPQEAIELPDDVRWRRGWIDAHASAVKGVLLRHSRSTLLLALVEIRPREKPLIAPSQTAGVFAPGDISLYPTRMSACLRRREDSAAAR